MSETVGNKSLEWNCDCWFASLDREKLFYQIEHDDLSYVSLGCDVDDGYVKVVAMFLRQ